MGNRVEVGRDVPFNDPVVSLPPDSTHGRVLDGIHCPAIGSEPKGVLTKIGLVDRLQNHAESFLYNPISNGRDAQWPILPAPIMLLNVHPAHRRRGKPDRKSTRLNSSHV